ncbi:hypothetical protein D3C71_1229430 [compost metagenome]
MVVGAETDRAVAYPQQQRPARRPLPPRLRELVHVLDPVALVTAQAALDTHLVTDEVLVTAAILLLSVGIGTDHHIQRAAGPITVPRPARVETAIGPVQIDHPAGMQRRVELRRRRDRQVLLHAALAGIAHRTPGLRALGSGEHQPGLGLAHGFAGVVLGSHRGGLTGVLAYLGTGEAERILRVGRIEVVQDQIQLAAADIRAQAGVDRFAPGLAVIAPAIGAEVVGGHVIADRPLHATQLGAGAEGVVAAGIQAQAPRVALGAVRAPHLHHAPRGVAVQRRERPAQHLHPLRREQAGVGELALAVGHGGRHTVHQHAYAAHAERRARTEATDRELGVLRIVLPITGDHPGNAAEGLGELGQRPGAVLVHPDRGQRGRQIDIGHLRHARGLDLDRGQPLDRGSGGGGVLGLRQRGQQHGRGQRTVTGQRGKTEHAGRDPR